MENIVKCHRIKWSINCLPNLALLSHEILSLVFDFIQFFRSQTEHRDGGQADEICICVIFDHKGTMVDNGAPAETFYNEILIFASTIVLNGDLDDPILDQIQPISYLVLLAEKSAFFESGPLHTIYKLLLRQKAELAEVGYFAHFHEEPSRQLVLILEHLLLKNGRERLERLGQLDELLLAQNGERAVVLRADRRGALRVKEHADLAEVVPVDQVRDGFGLVLLVDDDQVLRLHVHAELAVPDEVHKAFLLLVVEGFLLGGVLVLALVARRVDMGLVLLLEVDHVGPGEDRVQLADQLRDALVVLFQLEQLSAALGHVLAQ